MKKNNRPSNDFSSSVNRWAWLFKTSSIIRRKFFWYLVELGGCIFPSSTATRVFFNKDSNLCWSSKLISPFKVFLQFSWMGTTSSGRLGTTLTNPCKNGWKARKNSSIFTRTRVKEKKGFCFMDLIYFRKITTSKILVTSMHWSKPNWWPLAWPSFLGLRTKKFYYTCLFF